MFSSDCDGHKGGWWKNPALRSQWMSLMDVHFTDHTQGTLSPSAGSSNRPDSAWEKRRARFCFPARPPARVGSHLSHWQIYESGSGTDWFFHLSVCHARSVSIHCSVQRAAGTRGALHVFGPGCPAYYGLSDCWLTSMLSLIANENTLQWEMIKAKLQTWPWTSKWIPLVHLSSPTAYAAYYHKWPKTFR